MTGLAILGCLFMDFEFKELQQVAAKNETRSEKFQEEAQRALTGFDPQLKLDTDFSLKPSKSDQLYGPALDGDSNFKSKSVDSQDGYRVDTKREWQSQSRQELKDSFADRVFPGFGRLESSENSWRLDFLDTSGCSTKAKIGLCFRIKH